MNNIRMAHGGGAIPLGFFLGRGGDDGGFRGMSFYVLSRGLEDMMFVCVGGVDLERQNWEMSEFLML